MDNIDLIELLESEIDLLINKSHKSGLSYWLILRTLTSRLEGLMMRADAEIYMSKK